MNFLDKVFGSAILMVPTWALAVLAGWLGGFFLNYRGLPGAVACMVIGTVLGVAGGIYAGVRDNNRSK